MKDAPTRIAILGSGPGGYVAALRAARLGASVTLVEQGLIGGTCLNRGCIPTKALLASTEALAKARAGAEFGFVVNGSVEPDLDRMMERKAQVVDRMRAGVEHLLERAGVQVVRGTGRLAPGHRVVVETGDGTVTVEADKIIIATGSEPARLPAFDFDHPTVLTSTSALELTAIPSSLLIVGAGVIGCEFACIFRELGTKVTMVEMMPQMLPLEARRIAKQFQGLFKKRGVEVVLKSKVEHIARYAEDHVVAALTDGTEVTAEKILVSIGRQPNTPGLGLETVGVEVNSRGYVVVNDYLETSAPDIYAIGDVNGGLLLAHVASHEAWVAVDNCLGNRRQRDLRAVPACTYTVPEVASVGLNEEQAREAGYEPLTGTYRFAALGKAVAMGEDVGQVQLVADKETDMVLGASMMGPRVTDIIHEVALAVQLGMTVEQLGGTIHAHPTIAEAVMEAAHDVHSQSVHVA